VDLAGLPRSRDTLLLDFIRKLLPYDLKKLIAVDEGLDHPFFREVSPEMQEICWPPGLQNQCGSDEC
jgi:hypothetical protein